MPGMDAAFSDMLAGLLAQQGPPPTALTANVGSLVPPVAAAPPAAAAATPSIGAQVPGAVQDAAGGAPDVGAPQSKMEELIKALGGVQAPAAIKPPSAPSPVRSGGSANGGLIQALMALQGGGAGGAGPAPIATLAQLIGG